MHTCSRSLQAPPCHDDEQSQTVEQPVQMDLDPHEYGSLHGVCSLSSDSLAAMFEFPSETDDLDYNVDHQEVISRIEAFATWFVQTVERGQLPDIRCRIPNSDTAFVRSLVGKHPESADQYARLFAVLNICHELLMFGSRATLRDLHYRLKPMRIFASARPCETLSKSIQDVITLLNVPRSALGITCSTRGLVCGPLRAFHLDLGTMVMDTSKDGCMNTQGIPGDVSLIRYLSFDLPVTVEAILVVEKESVFQQLCAEPGISLSGRFVLVTGKGVPDLATRAFLSAVSAAYPGLNLFALVDWNPCGVNILVQYKWGSKHMVESMRYALPGLRWLGIRSDWLQHAESEAFQKLTTRDMSMIPNIKMNLEGYDLQAWIQEIDMMASAGVKADIEAVYGAVGGGSGLGPLIIDSIARQAYL